MQINLFYVVVFLISVFISSVSQVILKVTTKRKYNTRIREYLNVPVIISYGMFFCSSLLTMVAYRGVPLSIGPILETSGYIWISILGVLFLKEHISRNKMFGLVLIVVGILFFNR